tara:strand:+ start:43 stop:465 length:423 start_codon:yes stop_codon:yes gene_type:complete
MTTRTREQAMKHGGIRGTEYRHPLPKEIKPEGEDQPRENKKAPKDRGVPKWLQEIIDQGGSYYENPKTGEVTITGESTEPIFRINAKPIKKKKLSKEEYVSNVVTAHIKKNPKVSLFNLSEVGRLAEEQYDKENKKTRGE